MTLRTNARIAGLVFLLYIGTGIADMMVSSRATGGADSAARLASIAQNAPRMRVGILLTMSQIFWAILLGVSLWALTRDADRDLAMFGLVCRVGEGVVAALPTAIELALFSTAAAAASASGAAAASLHQTGAVLFALTPFPATIAATLFGAGSMAFSIAFLRARSIPRWLAWLGVAASVAVVIAIPLRAIRLIGAAAVWTAWMPMLVFELVLAGWLLTKGVAAPPEGRAGLR